jgi:hypothetical protein
MMDLLGLCFKAGNGTFHVFARGLRVSLQIPMTRTKTTLSIFQKGCLLLTWLSLPGEFHDCKNVECNCSCSVSVFCTETQAYVHEVMN